MLKAASSSHEDSEALNLAIQVRILFQQFPEEKRKNCCIRDEFLELEWKEDSVVPPHPLFHSSVNAEIMSSPFPLPLSFSSLCGRYRSKGVGVEPVTSAQKCTSFLTKFCSKCEYFSERKQARPTCKKAKKNAFFKIKKRKIFPLFSQGNQIIFFVAKRRLLYL